MWRHRLLVGCMLCGGCFFDIAPVPEQVPVTGTLVASESTWRFSAGIEEDGWETPGFDDGAWAEGAAPLGFGECFLATEIPNNCPAGTCDTPESYNCAGQFVAYYFRHAFEVPAGGTAQSLELSLLVDDGALVFLNGVEVARLRLPAGPIGPQTEATEPVSGSAETEWEMVEIGGDALSSGMNLLAVEVHQEGPGTDVVFDVALVAR
ncbi:MAG: hypothetical protein KC731_19045 [Myxococcales bacterium]|nr:hypothetical protein [Myxococcales bacterium]